MQIRPTEYDRGTIYLSGGMQYAEALGGIWRAEISKKLKAARYFPLDITELDVAYSKVHGELFAPAREKHLEFKSDIRKHFIHTDLNLIKHASDALIVLYDESARRGAGTISECQYAYNLNLPIFLVSAFPDLEKDVPGWLQGLTTKLFGDFESLMTYLEALPYGILKEDLYGNRRSGSNYLCSLCGSVFQKKKHLFVSKVTPLYCAPCVDIVASTNETKADRYDFFMDYLHDTQKSADPAKSPVPKDAASS